MARLFEYQGKGFLKDGGIAIPTGEIASTAKEAHEITTKIGKPVVIKALREAGAYPVETPKEIVPTLKKLLNL